MPPPDLTAWCLPCPPLKQATTADAALKKEQKQHNKIKKVRVSLEQRLAQLESDLAVLSAGTSTSV